MCIRDRAKAEGGNAVGFIGGEDVDLIRAFQAGFEPVSYTHL